MEIAEASGIPAFGEEGVVAKGGTRQAGRHRAAPRMNWISHVRRLKDPHRLMHRYTSTRNFRKDFRGNI